MVIIGNRNGKLANRLFHLSHFIANAKEYDYLLVYPFFKEYAKYFKLTSKNHINIPGVIIFNLSIFFRKILQYVILIKVNYGLSKVFFEVIKHPLTNSKNNSLNFDLSNKSFLSKAKKRIIICYGWAFRDYISFQKHTEIIKKSFRLSEPYNSNVQNLIKKCRERFNCIVGIHLRKGDYKNWRGGIYFFDNQVYKDIMLQMNRLLNGKVSFLLCSDENIVLEDFNGLNTFLSTKHFVEDLYALAACDYIIGPPSTYSMWASFYGSIPLLHIKESNQKVNLSDFSIIKDG